MSKPLIVRSHPDYPPRIVDISEKDFWSQLKPRPGRGDHAVLKRAIQAGQKGRRSQAYSLLAEYHSSSLLAEWEAMQRGVLPTNYHAPRQTAEDALKHKLWISHDTFHQYGKKIDWHKPRLGSTLHSFYWILPLLEKYVDAPEPTTAEALRDFILQYYSARMRMRWAGPDYHPIYTALAASIKFRHIFPIYVALACNGHLTPPATEAWMKMMLGMVRALHRRETDLVMGNQTITNVWATGHFAAAFPEFQESAAWRRRALLRIEQNVMKGFLPDGGFFERSFCYGGVSLTDAARALCAINRHSPISPSYRRKVGGALLNATRFFAKILAPGDYQSAYGDTTLARATSLLTVAQELFPEGTPPDLGVNRKVSCHFPDSGFTALRDFDKGLYALFSHGRCDHWHCHMDILNLDVWADGIPFLVEAGRFGHYSEPFDRLARCTEMHNTIAVDGQVYDERYPELLRGEAVGWGENSRFAWARASHRAYRGKAPVFPQGQDYLLTRTVVMAKKGRYFLTLDSALPAGIGPAGIISQHWHSPFPFKVLAPGFAVVKKGRKGMALITPAMPQLRRSDTSVDYNADESTGKLDFPERRQLRFRLWGASNTPGAIGCITALVPFEGKAPAIVVRRRPLGEGLQFQAERIEVKIGRRSDVFVLHPQKTPRMLPAQTSG